MGSRLGSWRVVTSALIFHHLITRTLEVQMRPSSFLVVLPPSLVNHSLLWGCRKAPFLFLKQFFTSKGWSKIHRKESGKEQTFTSIMLWECGPWSPKIRIKIPDLPLLCWATGANLFPALGLSFLPVWRMRMVIFPLQGCRKGEWGSVYKTGN